MNPSSASTIRQAPSFLTGPAGFEFDRKFGIRVFMATFLLSQKRTLESATGRALTAGLAFCRLSLCESTPFRGAKGDNGLQALTSWPGDTPVRDGRSAARGRPEL